MNYLYRLRFFIFIACLSILLWGILRPELPPELFKDSDKFLHLIAFMGLSLTARFAFASRFAVLIWLLLFLSAFALEFLQNVVQTTRFFSWQDAAANAIGVVLAIVIWQLAVRLYAKFRAKK